MRFEPKEALAVARQAGHIVVAKGKKVVTFDMKHDPPDDKTLLKHIMGPSGKLRAPVIRRGSTHVDRLRRGGVLPRAGGGEVNRPTRSPAVELEGKVAVVTGGSVRIGRAISVALAARGRSP